MAKIHRVSTTVLLCCVSFVALIVIAPAAAAASIDTHSPVAASTGHPLPVALASTGLNITLPVVLGLCALVLGIILVGWAVLRTGSAEHR